MFLGRRHIRRAAVIIRPSTLFKFHDILKQRKYRLLYSSARRTKPGPKGPSPELVRAIVEMKQRNPRLGCRRIAMQITDTFGIERHQQNLGSQSTGQALPPDTERRRAVVVDFSWAYQGQSLERRSISLLQWIISAPNGRLI